MLSTNRLALTLLLASSTTACVDGITAADGDDGADLVDTSVDDGTGGALSSHALAAGVNGRYCTASDYNCRFHDGDQRVVTNGGSESWGISPGASVRDGDGTALVLETGSTLTFNYGQIRTLAGKAHALALSTSNASAGWYPVDHILGEASFRTNVGNVDAKGDGLAKMACYEIRDTVDESLVLKKVVHNSQVGPTGHERAGDYLPLERANGGRSANLIFSVPGFGLGGATTDHFPAGSKFQRLDVPTDAGPPSISIPLWVQDGSGAYKKRSGTMRFLYGYIVGNGVERFGWMAQDALTPSSGC